MYVKTAAEGKTMGSSKKSVRWSTLTVYEFDVAIGGSSIPRHGGPSVGLAKTPKYVWSTPLDVTNDVEDCEEDEHGKGVDEPSTHCPDEDKQEQQAPERHARAMDKIRERQRRRRNRVRWLKPFERVTMLTQAGLSERRIYRMMKECAAICMSRRLSIQSP